MKRIPLVRRLLAAIIAVALAGCIGGAGYPRGQFSGYVLEKSEAEVQDKVGKPDAIDTTDKEHPVWVYKGKTFDTENNNQTDSVTRVIFSKDPATGKMKASELAYG